MQRSGSSKAHMHTVETIREGWKESERGTHRVTTAFLIHLHLSHGSTQILSTLKCRVLEPFVYDMSVFILLCESKNCGHFDLNLTV